MTSIEIRVSEHIIRESLRVYRQVHHANDDMVEMWMEHQFLQGIWWVQIAMIIIPWVIWFRVRKRDSTDRLLYAGFVALILASYMDFMGITFGAWVYHVELVPSIPSYTVWDFSLYPVATMLSIQLKPQVSPLIKAIAFSGTSLVIEVIFELLRWYQPLRWSLLYSLPIHVLNFLIAYWFSQRTGFAPITPPDSQRPVWTPPVKRRHDQQHF